MVKQKNQSAQKNVNLFLINTRGKYNKGKITSYGFGVVEQDKWIFRGEYKCSNLNLNLNSTEQCDGCA